MAAATVANSNVIYGDSAPAPVSGRFSAVYSELQRSRIDHALPLPRVLTGNFKIVDGEKSSAAGSPDEIAKLFPCLFGQPSSMVVPSDSDGLSSDQKLKIGVVLSGGQAPGGHNVICGIFDYFQARAKGSTLYGFRGGPAGIMKCKYVVLTEDFVHPYRNQGGFDMIRSGRDKIETPEQFKQAEETSLKLDLDGLVVIGGDDSNTNACLLAENFSCPCPTLPLFPCEHQKHDSIGSCDGDHPLATLEDQGTSLGDSLNTKEGREVQAMALNVAKQSANILPSSSRIWPDFVHLVGSEEMGMIDCNGHSL